jgi:membrane fusion protein, multidrug efflux system
MKNQGSHPKKTKGSGPLLWRFVMFGGSKIGKTHLYQTLAAKWGKRKLHRLIKVASLIALALLLWTCNTTRHDKNKQKPPVPVVVTSIKKSDVPVYLETIGTVTPIDSNIIKTQINGRITEVHFTEGQLVQKGDLLVQIDPRPYEAALAQAEGQLMKDEAFLKNAHLDLRRYKKLYNEDSVSQQTLDTQNALVKQYEGIVQSDQGLVSSAKVNLQYCKILSNITGVVGLRQINPGNLVQPSDTTPITTVNTISPISVVFSIPEDDLVRVQKGFRKEVLIAEAYDRKRDHLLCAGELTAIDSQIDNTTGTIKLRAMFKNEQYTLYPNQFVNVRLKVETLRDSLIIPTAAIQMGRQGPFVYLMNETNVASVKPVVIQTTVGDNSAIQGEIQEGQVVIIQGQDKLTEGAVVNPTMADFENPTASVGRASQ